MNLQDLMQQRKEALGKAESIVSTAERGRRNLTDVEDAAIKASMAEVSSLNPQIDAIRNRNTITRMVGRDGTLLTDGPRNGEKIRSRFTPELAADLLTAIQTSGRKVSSALLEHQDAVGGYPLPNFAAALYEGTPSQGGYAVPSVVDDQIVPLAPQEMAVRRLAMVIPTTSDIKFPVKASFGTSTAKAETSSFTENEPTLSQFTLSAFMAGILEEISWELAQDVPAFQAFAVDDMVLAQQMYEENLYINGTGSGQAQGLIGNVASGGVYEPDSNSNLVSIAGLLAIQGKLNAVYHPGAAWLMARSTSVIIRTAQMQSNLFYPAFTRGADGQDRLFGYPVEYAAAMPTATRGATPVLFGDFKRGYIIGDRGGSGINVKVLDQPLATQGLIQLLAYRRTDGRVRRSEAIQSYNISAS